MRRIEDRTGFVLYTCNSLSRFGLFLASCSKASLDQRFYRNITHIDSTVHRVSATERDLRWENVIFIV